MAWDNLVRTYAIRDARIVVTIDDGGAVVEKGDFEFDEGRYLSTYEAPRPVRCVLSTRTDRETANRSGPHC